MPDLEVRRHGENILNWEAVGAIGETVGALAVIISLLYLAVQIRQNTSQMKQSSELARLALRENFTSGQQKFFLSLVSNGDAFDVWKACNSSPEELSDDQREKVGLLFYDQMYRYQMMFHAKILDEQENARVLVQVRRITGMPTFPGWWSRQRYAFVYDPEFTKLVDKEVESRLHKGA